MYKLGDLLVSPTRTIYRRYYLAADKILAAPIKNNGRPVILDLLRIDWGIL